MANQYPLKLPDAINIFTPSDLPFIKIALAKHTEVTNEILHLLIPDSIEQQTSCELAQILVDHSLTDIAIINKIAALLVNIPEGSKQLALQICRHPEVEFALIRAIILGKNVNSDFRYSVGRVTTRQNVKQLLAEIKNRIKKNNPKPKEKKILSTSKEPPSFINPLVAQMTSMLKGKVLRRDENQSDRDYSGGGFFWERNRAIYLYDNGAFEYQDKVFQSISSGGLSLSSPTDRVDRRTGQWAIEAYGQLVYLVLKSNSETLFSIRTDTGPQGIQILDGEAWHRYLIQ